MILVTAWTLPTDLRECIKKQHDYATTYRATRPGSRILPQRSCVCVSAAVDGGKETIWAQKNSAAYECGISRMTILPPTSEALLKVAYSCRNDCDTRKCSEWNSQLRVINAGVSEARTRPCCPQRMLATLTKGVACLKW